MDRKEANETLRLRVLTMLAVVAIVAVVGVIGGAALIVYRVANAPAAIGGDDGSAFVAAGRQLREELDRERAECMAKNGEKPAFLCADATLPLNAPKSVNPP